MRERARSDQDKAERSEALLEAAQALALELGGVRYLTVAAVTERAGLHRTGARRYYASKEDLLLGLAERGWTQWRDTVKETLRDRTGLEPGQVAGVLADTITSQPVFCDLLAHVPMSLEGDVDIERARRYKTNAFAAHDEIVAALEQAGSMSTGQIQSLMSATVSLTATMWQASHPTPALASLYEQVPRWGHAALEFAPKLRHLLKATATGLVS
jgi:AcrR family transcriptional regulator